MPLPPPPDPEVVEVELARLLDRRPTAEELNDPQAYSRRRPIRDPAKTIHDLTLLHDWLDEREVGPLKLEAWPGEDGDTDCMDRSPVFQPPLSEEIDRLGMELLRDVLDNINDDLRQAWGYEAEEGQVEDDYTRELDELVANRVTDRDDLPGLHHGFYKLEWDRPNRRLVVDIVHLAAHDLDAREVDADSLGALPPQEAISLNDRMHFYGVSSFDVVYEGSGDDGSHSVENIQMIEQHASVPDNAFSSDRVMGHVVRYDWYNNEGGRGRIRVHRDDDIRLPVRTEVLEAVKGVGRDEIFLRVVVRY